MGKQTIINAEKSLNNEKMTEFLSKVDNNSSIILLDFNDIDNVIADIKTDDIRTIFTDDNVAKKVEDCEKLSLISIDDDVELMFLKQDYFWFFNKPRRLNSLFSTETKQKSVKQEPVEIRLNIACGTKKDGKIENIEYLTGNDKDIVRFINEQYCERLLKSFFKDKIVFNIAYSSKEELEDESMWFTFDELKEGGIIEV